MSATPLKYRTYNESCSYTGGNILFYFSYKAWFCSALYQCKAGVTPLKSLVLKRHFQNQSCKSFLQKNLPNLQPFQFNIFSVRITVITWAWTSSWTIIKLVFSQGSCPNSWQQAINLCTRLWPKYFTYKQERTIFSPFSKQYWLFLWSSMSVLVLHPTKSLVNRLTNEHHSLELVIGQKC